MASAITRRVSDRYIFAHSHIYTCELSSTATVHLHSVSDTSAEMAYDSIHFYTCIYFHCYIVTCLQGSRVWLWRLTQAHADSSYKVDSAPPQSVSPSSNESSNWETFCYGLDSLTSGLLLYPSSLIYLYFFNAHWHINHCSQLEMSRPLLTDTIPLISFCKNNTSQVR